MKIQRFFLLFFSIIILFVSGCYTVETRPMVVGSPIPPGNPGFQNQRGARDISPMRRMVGQFSFQGVTDTVKVINNSSYLISIAEGPVWIYPNSEPFIVSLDRVAQSYYSNTTNITVQVFDAQTHQQVTTIVSPNYWRTQVNAYSQVREYTFIVTNQLVSNWINGRNTGFYQYN